MEAGTEGVNHGIAVSGTSTALHSS
jgi:hypothetical protein